MMQFTTPTRAFHITSHGNGWAYEVHCNTTGDSFWVQDDSAAQLQHDSENFTNEHMLAEYLASGSNHVHQP